MNLKPYAKTVVAATIAGLTALQAAISDDTVTRSEWVAIGLATLTAIGVFFWPNKTADSDTEV